MSQQIVNEVNASYPALLQSNINSTCFQFAKLVIEALKKAGHTAELMCKTAGEGQYTPPGFVPFIAVGLDNKPYTITGFSHDAIWCDGEQFDTIGRGNDSPDPIFDAHGNRVTGIPTWNAIPRTFWRPNNPPYTGQSPAPGPTPTPGCVFPPRDQGLAFFNALDKKYELKGYAATPYFVDKEGTSVWYAQYLLYRTQGNDHATAQAKVFAEIDAIWHP